LPQATKEKGQLHLGPLPSEGFLLLVNS